MPRKILNISDALSNPLRRRILLVLLEVPGISLRQLAERLNIGMGNLAGHLLILERVGLVREVRSGRRVRLFVNEELFLGHPTRFRGGVAHAEVPVRNIR